MSIYVPAYGRDYTKKAEVVAAWNEGKDFADPSPFAHGTYINRADAEAAGMTKVLIRFKRQLNVTTLTRNKTTGEWK